MPDTHEDAVKQSLFEEDVLAVEDREIWRLRLRRRLPFLSLSAMRELEADASALKCEVPVLEWVNDVLAIARCIEDEHSPAAAATAVRERSHELLGAFDSVGDRLLDEFARLAGDLPHLVDNFARELHKPRELRGPLPLAELDAGLVRLERHLAAMHKILSRLQRKLAKLLAAVAGVGAIRADDPLFDKRRIGLALSGGGIRSASFNLGILESLHKYEILPHIDYLSTVSGGGYIGSAWTFHAARERNGFPFSGSQGVRDNKCIDWIRAHGSYLNSGREVNSLTLAASLVRGIGLNLLFIVPLFFAVMWWLTRGCFRSSTELICRNQNQIFADPLVLVLALLAAALSLLLFRHFKGRRVPESFQIPFWQTFLVGAVSVVVASVWHALPWRGEIAQILIVGPLACLGLWSLFWSYHQTLQNEPTTSQAGPGKPKSFIRAVADRWWSLKQALRESRTPRIRILVAETLAWSVVAGLIYLLMQAVPLEAPFPFWHLLLALVGAMLLAKLAVNFIFMALLSFTSSLNPGEQRSFSVQYGDLLGMGLFFGILGALPLIDESLRAIWDTHSDKFLGGLTVTGVISTALGWLRRGAGSEVKGYVAFFLRFGVTVLIGAALLWMYRLALSTHAPGTEMSAWNLVFIIALILLWILAAVVTDINYMSMHRYYRNRLADAFLVDPYVEAALDGAASKGVRMSADAAAYLATRAPEEVERVIDSIAAGPPGVSNPTPAAKTLGGKITTLVSGRQLELDDAMAMLNDPGYRALRQWAASRLRKSHFPDDVLAYIAARVGFHADPRKQVLRELEQAGKPVDMAAARDVIDACCQGVGVEMCSRLALSDVDVGLTGTPYHIINANLVLPGSRSEKFRLRRGDSFTFSPRFVGSNATRWTSSGNYRDLGIGTAMAISGAAVDPNTGVALSMPLRIVMTLLNARLGYWTRRPGPRPKWTARRLWDESWPVLAVREMFGLMHEDSAHVRLSDGGHFENLGLYELVRRRCDPIIVCDAAADPAFGFGDLARAIERVRVDFGAKVEIDTMDLHPQGSPRQSQSPFVVGWVTYPPRGRRQRTRARLVLIKSALFPDLPEDVLGYARAHPSFPDETTADQFFTEEQFEAYRELGYYAGAAARIAVLRQLMDSKSSMMPDGSHR